MASQIFDIVWYLPHENRWRDLNLLALSGYRQAHDRRELP